MIKTFAPSSAILAKYIACIYLYEGQADTHFRYLAFPHFHTGLSFFCGASVARGNWSIHISEDPQVGVHVEVLGKYTTPLLLQYQGKLREISLVFKPLGMNRFFKQDYQTIAPKFSQELGDEVWKKQGEALFASEDVLKELEDFLLSQVYEDQDFSVLEKSLPYLENSIEQLSISSIAERVGLNSKTFQRHFHKHLGCSPVEYRRIVRFRSALTNKLTSAELKNLTELTYEGGYYDQSYLIREFRKLTNRSPKDFFKSMSRVDGNQIIWEIK